MEFIGSKTMFDFEDFYNKVADELPDNCRIAEVGVADGASALYLASRLHSLGKSFKLFMIDSLDYGHADQLMTIIKNVQSSGLGEYIDIIPFDSLNASLRFNDQSFNFVFIDASHTFEGTKADIRLWAHKIAEDGRLAGHDYSKGSPGVTDAVNELIPTDMTEIYETKDGYGVWSVKNKIEKKFKP